MMDGVQTMKDLAVTFSDVVRSADCEKYFVDELSSFPLKRVKLNITGNSFPIPCSTSDAQALYGECMATGTGIQVSPAEVTFPKNPNMCHKIYSKVKDLFHKLRVSTEDIALNIVFDHLLLYSKQHQPIWGQNQAAANHFATFVLTLPCSDRHDLPRDEIVNIVHRNKENQFVVHTLSNIHPTAALFFNDHAFILQKNTDASQDEVGLALVFHVFRQDARCTDIPLMMFSKHIPAAASSLRRQITNWAVHTRPTDKQQFLIFPLQHMYAEDGLSFGMLKGSDASLWSAMAPQRHFLTYDLALVDDMKGVSFLHSIPWNIDGKDGERQLKGLNFFPDCECVITLPHPDFNNEEDEGKKDDEDLMDCDESNPPGLKLHRAVIVISIRHRFASIEAERRTGSSEAIAVTTSVSSSTHHMVLSTSTTLSSEGGGSATTELTPIQSLEQSFDASLKHLATSVYTRMTSTNSAGVTVAMDCLTNPASSSSSSAWNQQQPPPQASSSCSSSNSRAIGMYDGNPTYFSSRYYNGVENDDMKKSRSDPHRRLQFLRQRLEMRTMGRARYMMNEGGGGPPQQQQQQHRAYPAPPPPSGAPPPLPRFINPQLPVHQRLERQNAATGRVYHDSPPQDRHRTQLIVIDSDEEDNLTFDDLLPRPNRSRGLNQMGFDPDYDNERVDRRNMENREHREAAARQIRDQQREQLRRRWDPMEEARRVRHAERERTRVERESVRRPPPPSDYSNLLVDDDDNTTIDFNDFMADYNPWDGPSSMFAPSTSGNISMARRMNSSSSNSGAWIPAAPAPAPAPAPARRPVQAPAASLPDSTRARMPNVFGSASSNVNIERPAQQTTIASSASSAGQQPQSISSRLADAQRRVEERRAQEARAISNSMSAELSLEELMQTRSSSPFWEMPTFPPLTPFAPAHPVFVSNNLQDFFDDMDWTEIPSSTLQQQNPQPATAGASAATVQHPAVASAQLSSSSAINSALVDDEDLPPSRRRKRALASIVRDAAEEGDGGEEQRVGESSSGLRRSRRFRGLQQQG